MGTRKDRNNTDRAIMADLDKPEANRARRDAQNTPVDECEEELNHSLDQLGKKTRYESIIRVVTQSIHQSIKLEEVLENAVGALHENLDGVDYVGIYIAEGKKAVLKAHRGLPDSYIEKAGWIPYPKGFTWKVINEGKPRYCSDADRDKFIGPAGRKAGIKSYLAMPLSLKDKTVGTININSLQKNVFDEDALNLLDMVARQIEIAINNAKQAEELRASEERYRILFDQSPLGVFLFNSDLAVVDCNKRLAQIIGAPRGKIVGLNMRKLKDRVFVPALERVFEGESGARESIYTTTITSRKLYLSMSFSPLRDREGNVILGMGVVEDITLRRQAEQELRENLAQLAKKSRYEQILRTVTQSVHRSIDIDEVFKNAADAMMENIEAADLIGIHMVEGEEALLKTHRGYPDWFAERVKRIPYPKGLTWKTIIEGKAIHCSDTARDKIIGPAGKEAGIKSYASMPLQYEGKTIGSISLGSQRTHAFDQEELKLIETVAQQIDVAINNAKRAEALKKGEERLKENLEQLYKHDRYETIISAVTQSVHSSIDLHEVFERAVDALRENIKGVENVAIYLVDGDVAAMQAQRGYPQWFIERAGRIPRPKGFTWKTILEGKPTYVADAEKDPTIGPAGRELGTLSYISIPLRHENETVGCITINSVYKNAFQEDEFKLLQIVAGQIEVAIGNAQKALALKASEENYRSIFNSANDAIFIHDFDTGDILDANRKASEMYGYSQEEFWKLRVEDICVPPPQYSEQNTLRLIKKAMNEGTQILEWLAKDKSGRLSWVEVNLRDTVIGNKRRLLAVVRDITERKRAEEKIQEQAALLDKASDAIFVLDMNQNIVFWNAGAEQLYGFTSEEVLGRNINVEVSPQPNEALNTAKERGEWSGESNQITKDGKEIAVKSRWTLVSDDSGEPTSILIINTDITENKRLEAQYLRAQRLESIGTMAGGIAHDLNNVLQPIMMSLHILRSRHRDEKNQKLIDMLQHNVNRGANLVNQVLSFSKGIEAERVPIQLRHLIRSTEKILKETFPKSITIETDVPRTLWTISGNPTQIDQILMNLCVNARDAMPQGGTLSISAQNAQVDEGYTRVNIDAKPGPYVVVSVSDTGEGIAPEIMDSIFDPYFTTKEKGKGTGLGLSTAFGIVKNHGGFINVYSEVGRGTTFKVYFPVGELGAEDRQVEESTELPTGRGELIMVVDDEESILTITAATLESNGYRTLTAHDGTEAVALYAKNKEDVKAVLLDMMMPVMDGPATLRALKKISPGIKIIGTSGFKEHNKLTGIDDNQMDSFLWKPYTAETLMSTVKEVLDSGE